MLVLVTGATGLLGNNVIRHLLRQGDEVRVLVRASGRRSALEDLYVEPVLGDLRDGSRIEQAVRGVDAVIHCGALIHIGRKRRAESFAVNEQGTRHLITAANTHAVPLVHVSTVDTLAPATSLGEPISETAARQPKPSCSYVDSKKAAERIVQDAANRGEPVSIVYPGFMLGPWDWGPSSGRMLLGLAKHQPLFAPTGGLSICHASEVAAAIVRVASRELWGRKYILAGENISLRHFWRMIAGLLGKRKPCIPLGPLARWITGTAGDLLTACGNNEPDFNRAALRMSACYHYYDSRRAITEIQYRVPPVRQCIADSWNWLADHGYHCEPRIDDDSPSPAFS